MSTPELDPKTQALRRLHTSRHHLLHAMTPPEGDSDDGDEGGSPGAWLQGLGGLGKLLGQLPLSGLILQSLGRSFKVNHWRAALALVGGSGGLRLAAKARRHPFLLVGGGALAGALLFSQHKRLLALSGALLLPRAMQAVNAAVHAVGGELTELVMRHLLSGTPAANESLDASSKEPSDTAQPEQAIQATPSAQPRAIP